MASEHTIKRFDQELERLNATINEMGGLTESQLARALEAVRDRNTDAAEQVIAGPETEVSADKTRATTRMKEIVQDGVLQRSWCIIPGDPSGTYTYDITIDGEPRGEFVFCAIEIPDQNPNVDPRDLSCPNKFNAVQRSLPFSPKAS